MFSRNLIPVRHSECRFTDTLKVNAKTITSRFFKQLQPQKLRHGLILISMAITPMLLSGCGEINQASEVLFWGKTPDEEKLVELKKLGVKSIVNVRFASCKKVEAKAKELGMKFYHIRTGVFLLPKDKEIDTFLSIIKEPENRPVYVYCVGAKDRTTFYLALHRMAALGWTPERASKEMRIHGLRKWWPWFWRYDDQLRKYEPEIRQVAKESFSATQEIGTASDAPACTCKVVRRMKSKSGLLSEVGK